MEVYIYRFYNCYCEICNVTFMILVPSIASRYSKLAIIAYLSCDIIERHSYEIIADRTDNDDTI